MHETWRRSLGRMVMVMVIRVRLVDKVYLDDGYLEKFSSVGGFIVWESFTFLRV